MTDKAERLDEPTGQNFTFTLPAELAPAVRVLELELSQLAARKPGALADVCQKLLASAVRTAHYRDGEEARALHHLSRIAYALAYARNWGSEPMTSGGIIDRIMADNTNLVPGENDPHTVDLRAAVARYPNTCGAVHVNDAGDLKIHGNAEPLELADLFERAAGTLRRENDPNATELA